MKSAGEKFIKRRKTYYYTMEIMYIPRKKKKLKSSGKMQEKINMKGYIPDFVIL